MLEIDIKKVYKLWNDDISPYNEIQIPYNYMNSFQDFYDVAKRFYKLGTEKIQLGLYCSDFSKKDLASIEDVSIYRTDTLILYVDPSTYDIDRRILKEIIRKRPDEFKENRIEHNGNWINKYYLRWD